MARKKLVTPFDRFLMGVAPGWAAARIRSRIVATVLARHYEGAGRGPRTSGWHRGSTDANAANGPALDILRNRTRDLVRNNPWARRGIRVIGNNTVGWGITPRPKTDDEQLAARAMDLWQRWAETTDCDADGVLTFPGIQRQSVETIAVDGEILLRRRRRRPSDGLALPLAIQLLEPDFIDTSKDGFTGPEKGPVVQGVEFDPLGRRVAYYLFDQHPGARGFRPAKSNRVPASDIIPAFRLERPGQVRGVSWLAPVVVRLGEYDEYEDASIVRHKIAAMFAAFITDPNGDPEVAGVGEQTPEPGAAGGSKTGELLEPGIIRYLAPGQTVEFGTPPVAQDGGFSERTLRAIAAGLGITYEDLTTDYSKVNFSSARMARLSHWANVHDWQWNMVIPQVCDGVWRWAMDAAVDAGLLPVAPAAEWTPPPMPMIDPASEGLSLQRLVRTGAMTHDEMVRERGYDPETHWKKYAEGLKKLDKLGIVLDSDPRRATQSGQAQQPSASGEKSASDGDAGEQG